MAFSDVDRSVAGVGAVPSELGRRGFLKWISAIGATLIGAIVGLPAVRAFVAPTVAGPVADDWVKVADDVALIDTGVPLRVDFVQTLNDAWVEARAFNSVWLYTEDGEKFVAYNGKCTHLGCSYVLDKEKKDFHCPCHHGEFDVKTGRVIGGPPPRPLDRLPAEVRGSEVWVRYRDFRLGIPEKVEA